MTLPELPVEHEDPWYSDRQAFDLAVKSELEGRLSAPELAQFVDERAGTSSMVSQLALPPIPGGLHFDGYKPPVVMQRSNFDKGFDGWTQHGNSDASYPQLSRTDRRTAPGSGAALNVGVGSRPYQYWGNTIQSGTNAAMQRGSLTFDRGMFMEIYRYVMYGFDTDITPRQYGFQNDIEGWGKEGEPEHWRAIPTVRCQRVEGSRSGGTIERVDRWEMRDDSGNWITIFEDRVLGPNENKLGEEWLTTLIDMDMFRGGGGSDDCPWGVRQVTIGDKLVQLNQSGTPQVGRGKRTPQGDTGVGMWLFNGGFNRGVFVQNNTTEEEPGPSGMLLLESITLYYEPLV